MNRPLFVVKSAAILAAVIISGFPETLGPCKKVQLYPQKNQGGGGKITNHRIGITLADEVYEKLSVTIPILSYEDVCRSMNISADNPEKKGEYILDPALIDGLDNPIYTASIWYDREFEKKDGKPGTKILQGLPFHSIRPVIEAALQTLKDPETYKQAVKDGWITTSNPIRTNDGLRRLTILSYPMAAIEESLREITLYGTVKPDGTVFFDVKGNNWAIGTRPNFRQEKNRRNPDDRPVGSVMGGEIPALSSNTDNKPEALVKSLQKTIDDALKIALDGLKLEKLTVEVVQQNRQSRTQSARERVLSQALDMQLPEQQNTPATTRAPEAAPSAENAFSDEPSQIPAPAGSAPGEEISFDDIPS